jgi:hypothetical protein
MVSKCGLRIVVAFFPGCWYENFNVSLIPSLTALASTELFIIEFIPPAAAALKPPMPLDAAAFKLPMPPAAAALRLPMPPAAAALRLPMPPAAA